jgi:hypothetical protein
VAVDGIFLFLSFDCGVLETMAVKSRSRISEARFLIEKCSGKYLVWDMWWPKADVTV